jgi:Protein of unknown function (DUF1573)
MKNLLYAGCLTLLGFGLPGCDGSQKAGETTTAATNAKMPKIELAEKNLHDFGTITEGDTVEHVFKFQNAGNFPLIINNITASCGCTTPEWSRDPIAPGEESFVRVRFNSRHKEGEQNKTVTIFANTEPAMTDIRFRAMVNPKTTTGSSKTTPQ